MTLAHLTFAICPSPSTADHEARPLVDGQDLLGRASLGLDPPDLIAQLSPPRQGFARIGRCDCGVIGCGDEAADITLGDTQVSWKLVDRTIAFDRLAYLDAIDWLLTDHTWEDVGRRVERLMMEAARPDRRWQTRGLRLDWISTRVASRRVHVSFTEDGAQSLLMTAWDGRTEQSALDALAQLFDKEFGPR